MTFLLDTHVILWWWAASSRLSESVAKIIENPENSIFVSPISAYEISFKHRLGKLSTPERFFEDYEKNLREERWQTVPISTAVTLLAGQLQTFRRDPFDRILAAQAIESELVLLTADKTIQQFEGLETMW